MKKLLFILPLVFAMISNSQTKDFKSALIEFKTASGKVLLLIKQSGRSSEELAEIMRSGKTDSLGEDLYIKLWAAVTKLRKTTGDIKLFPDYKTKLASTCLNRCARSEITSLLNCDMDTGCLFNAVLASNGCGLNCN